MESMEGGESNRIEGGQRRAGRKGIELLGASMVSAPLKWGARIIEAPGESLESKQRVGGVECARAPEP